jgi:two-component system heavy metal sensor histidine kinase CusS
VNSKSLAFRLAVLVALLGLVQAIGVLSFSYFAFDRELNSQKRQVLTDKVNQARQLVSELPNAAAIRGNAFRLVDLLTGHDELHLAIAAPGSIQPLVAFSPEANDSLVRLHVDTWDTDAFLKWVGGLTGDPMLSMAGVAETQDGKPYEIVISIDLASDRRLLHGLLIIALTAAPLALAFAFGSAWGIVRIGLGPLKRLRQATSRVSANALSERLELDGLPTELHTLGLAFNAMLERLDDGVKRLSEFSGDLAHEMRTPLATLLGQTQVALSRHRTTEELLVVLESNVDELQRLTRLVADMLFLAHADDAQSALQFQQFDIAEEAHRVVAFLEILAQERDVSLVIDGGAVVVADRSLVQRAITNMVSNAIRHCYASTRIAISISDNQDGTVLEVVNRGEPIAPEHLLRLFERFYRIDEARARDIGGSGLGLAIVKAIMQMHGGQVRVLSSADGETRFTLVFPPRAPRA